MSQQWTPGDKAKWLGARPMPRGATWNPPPPGWKPPTDEEREFATKLGRQMHVTILCTENGVPTVAQSTDGFIFDPSVDIGRLVPASHNGWEHPDPRLR